MRPIARRLFGFLSEGDKGAQLARIARVFGDIAGLPTAIDTTDGYRMSFASGAILHLRPSGNAPELRCYSEAETKARARDLNGKALAHVMKVVIAELQKAG